MLPNKTKRSIEWVLDRAIDGRQQIGVTKMRLELDDTRKFENMLNEKIQELEIELDASKAAREKEVLTNEIDALNCVLGHLFNLKSGGNIAQPIEIADLNLTLKEPSSSVTAFPTSSSSSAPGKGS
jgi:hypothetical protein